MQQILSAATVAAIGLSCKAYLHSGLCSISVRGLPPLLEALNSPERQNGQGLVTVSNHLSTCAVPVPSLSCTRPQSRTARAQSTLAGSMTRSPGASSPPHVPAIPHDAVDPRRIGHYVHQPVRTPYFLSSSCAHRSCSVFSAFFRKGQVLETFRGTGVYQPAIDTAIEKLRAGAWIHLFAEGKVCQPHTYATDPQTGLARLRRFKWGIGRIVMETPRPPAIIPMWITGFDKLMPEGRHAPWKYLPRPGARLSVTFGAPVSPAAVLGALGTTTRSDVVPGEAAEAQEARRREVRIALTEVVQRAVEALGRQVSGDLLTGSGPGLQLPLPPPLQKRT
ncbi:acyltransferase-domain-containing protein [Lactarius pseudohatsudake]|nr:acyltransferase-domain-containing protein [Lactarius pseudohatsudake]